jgi:hypothetical protein
MLFAIMQVKSRETAVFVDNFKKLLKTRGKLGLNKPRI